MNDNNNKVISFSVAPLLLVAFVVLKLCGVIEWSWIWVLAPFWIPIALVIAIGILAFIILIFKDGGRTK